MPGSRASVFGEAENFQAALNEEGVAGMLFTGRGQFRARLTQVELEPLKMQGVDNLGDFAVQIRASPVDAAVPRQSPAGWALGRHDRARHHLVPHAAWTRRLHAAVGRLAEEAPEIIANPEVARGLEQALIEAMVGCLGVREVREDRSALRHHAMIMRRFRRAVEENIDQALYIPDLCKSIGVSDRTLRVCCQEQLGMSPKWYLLYAACILRGGPCARPPQPRRP